MDVEQLLEQLLRLVKEAKKEETAGFTKSGLTKAAFQPGFTPEMAVDVLRNRASYFLSESQKKVALFDGRDGYRVRAEVEFEIIAGTKPSDPKAPREKIKMSTTDAQVFLSDPVLTLDGTLRIDLEIISFTLEGVSKALAGNETPIRMHCGRLADKMMRKTLGRIEVPRGVEFGQVPVRVIHEVFVTVETPMGVLHNREPAIMMGHISKMPPINQVYEQIGHVPLYNDQGDVVAVKQTQRSTIIGLA